MGVLFLFLVVVRDNEKAAESFVNVVGGFNRKKESNSGVIDLYS